jgi:hypothetical protein
MLTRMEPALDVAWSAASTDIAGRLGVTKQAVHRKHSKRTGSR